MIVKQKDGCPWYVPDSACEACEQACKEKVVPILVGSIIAALVVGYLVGKD
mgnify:CR=1 FL=1